LRTWNLLRKADQALQRPYGPLCTFTKSGWHNDAAQWILSPLFYPSQGLRVERLRQRGLRFARPEKVRPVGLAEQTKEQRRIVFRIHVVHETASQNRWTPQQALQQLFVLLILRLRSRHAFPVEAQLADHFRLDLHPIDFNAQHFLRENAHRAHQPRDFEKPSGAYPPRVISEVALGLGRIMVDIFSANSVGTATRCTAAVHIML
jgi:hypothetical protein